jgi:hypothetical protein
VERLPCSSAFERRGLGGGKHTSCTAQQIVIILFFMKQYVIDELRPKDYETIKAYMDENFNSSNVGGIYWLQLDQNILTEVQKEHAECQPFYFAVDLEQNLMAFELLVRTKNRIRCNCMGYATEKQRNWLVGFADSIFDKLKIKT